ncbi:MULTISPECIES: hypothetical protein [Bacillus]|uniref:Uncharacterized protein n=1 Tax=Bacillus subtilis TaxID=1423 RepID=A0AAP1E8V3_BACIU|nr:MULTISPECIES: hypothetical protein [Bacillus]KIN55629.1 hypothetical protein B4146_3110 [Bacillus subtilis]KKB93982.1 hypothetical protein WB24_00455 [Bacillus sp. CMAA 1185]KZD89333.1 hypothetical protein B4122_3719 [Bacillus subtilis]MBC9023249.1 hypothetical protein [Bacillus subtilis]MCA0105706.1 hypothetical protein [Bacillus subtilis]
MAKQIINKTAHGVMVWDTEEKRSYLLTNDEAAKLEKEQGTTEEPAADKAEEKPKQTKTKPAAKKEETTDGE